MVYLSSFTLSFALTLWLSRFILKYLDPTIFMDHPADRKLHDEPVPRYGGIAFGLVILVVGGFLLGNIQQYGWYILGGAALFILGAIDDYWSLSWRIKLPIQLAIGLFISFQFIGKVDTIYFFNHEITLPVIGLVILFLFWFIGIVNSVNLIDGMDGLAGGFMLLTCFGAVVLGLLTQAYEFVILNSVVIGSMAAFLHFNQRPAKFFMGDSGSLLLGFHLAMLPLLFYQSMPTIDTVDVTPFIILVSYLIVDTVRVFYMRIRDRRNPLMPDTSHLHHIMYKTSDSYNGTLITIFLILAISGIVAVLQNYFSFGTLSMVIYLSFLGFFIVFPTVTKSFVRNVAVIIRTLNQNRNTWIDKRYLFRVRYVPFLVIFYFSGLLLTTWGSSFLQTSAPMLTLGFGILFLYILFSPRTNVLAEVIVIGMGIFQGILLIQTNIQTFPNLIIVANILRYGSLSLLSVITVLNYIIHTKNLTEGFWSVIDLLVLFILVGFAILPTLGFGVSPVVSFELGIIYFANKLYTPRLFAQTIVAPEPVR